tara:strand:- start:247 stop:480 length:234 start_codon:yes stop_codon:yes gene_type:complete
MKGLLIFLFGIFLGSWISWPGIISSDNWKCFWKILNDAKKDKISLKTALTISPKILLRADSMDYPSKLRIVSDACFR